MRKWTVLVDWQDDGVEDTDELVVEADTKAKAAVLATEMWTVGVSSSWPRCVMTNIYIEPLREGV